MATTIENIRLFLITPSKMNPRKSFDEEALRELGDNIKRQGLLQPITVRPVQGVTPYEIVCGERRYRACSLIGAETIACIVRDMSDDEALDAMITENLQRMDIDPVEESEAFRLLNSRGQSVEELSLRFGKSQGYIRGRMQLTGLVPEVKELLTKKAIPIGGALILSKLSSEDQKAYFDEQYGDEAKKQQGYHSETVEDIKEFCDDYFMNLWKAPFMDGEDLKEAWNPDGKAIRRCDQCPGCSINQGVLFPEMESKEPRCTLRSCYEKKCEMYFGWWLEQHKERIAPVGSKPSAGKIHLYNGQGCYSPRMKQQLQQLADKMTSLGYGVFTNKDLGSRLWEHGEEAVQEGKAVEVYNIEFMLDRTKPRCVYYYLKNEAEEGLRRQQDMAYKLANELRKIREKNRDEANNLYRSLVGDSNYTDRKGRLELWEENMLVGIVVSAMSQLEQKKIAGNKTISPTYEDIVDFRQKMHDAHDESWKRKAISQHLRVGFHRDTFLKEAAMWIDGERVKKLLDEQHEKNWKDEQDIIEELKEMGFDENGSRL